MKKILLILLALTMFALPLCSCDAELTEKQQEKIDLYEKYEDLIEAIEDEDYDEAIAELDGFFEDDKNEEDTETDENDGNVDSEAVDTETNDGNDDIIAGTEAPEDTEAPEEIATWTAPIIPGVWTYYDYDEESNVSFTVYDDGICEIFGVEYEWTLGYVRDWEETYFEIDITDGTEPVYQVHYQYDSDNDRWYSYLYAYIPEDDSYNNISSSAYDIGEMTVVEITTDNWYDYFEYIEVVTPSFNAFNELTDVSLSQRFALKSEYSAAYYPTLSSIAVEYSYLYGSYYTTVDTTTYEITVKSANYINDERSSTISSYLNQDYDNGYYYIYLNSSSISDFENGYCWISTDITIDRVMATLYFFN